MDCTVARIKQFFSLNKKKVESTRRSILLETLGVTDDHGESLVATTINNANVDNDETDAQSLTLSEAEEVLHAEERESEALSRLDVENVTDD